jgi:hypothetical protein
MMWLIQNNIFLIIIMVLSACSIFVPKEHLVPKETLIREIAKKFPLRHEEGGRLLSLVFESPQLSLLPEQNRVRIQGQFSATALMLNYKGEFVLSGQLKYDSTQHALFLSEAQIDSLQPGGNLIEGTLKNLIQRKFAEFASQNPLHVFCPDELVLLGAKMEVNQIHIVSDGILIKLHVAK